MKRFDDPPAAARVVRRVSLMYRGGADPALDRPAHVRAASGLCHWGKRLAVVSDDASFAGVVDPATGLVDPLTVPHAPGGRRQFDTGRGNKADKLDLECAICIGDRLIGFGSDSGLEVRRQVVVAEPGRDARVIPMPRLYAALGAALGSVLNLEGAAVLDDDVVFGNRGGHVGPDGAPSPDAILAFPVAALLALLDDPDGAPLPPLRWEHLSLGELRGAPLHLTELDVMRRDRGRWLWYAATAEATATAYDDGVVTGSVVGIIRGLPDLSVVVLSRTPVVDEHGAPLVAKIEGMAAAESWGVLVTIDADDPDRASELLEISVS